MIQKIKKYFLTIKNTKTRFGKPQPNLANSDTSRQNPTKNQNIIIFSGKKSRLLAQSGTTLNPLLALLGTPWHSINQHQIRLIFRIKA